MIEEDYPVSSKKMLAAMSAVKVGFRDRPVIMEVIGSQGKKIGEYVAGNDRLLPYNELLERSVFD